VYVRNFFLEIFGDALLRLIFFSKAFKVSRGVFMDLADMEVARLAFLYENPEYLQKILRNEAHKETNSEEEKKEVNPFLSPLSHLPP
jgi:hypothetical protein